MSDADLLWLLAGCVAGLAICSVADAIQIGRLRADVDFLTTIAERNLRSADHG
jgi:hypothetical protein